MVVRLQRAKERLAEKGVDLAPLPSRCAAQLAAVNRMAALPTPGTNVPPDHRCQLELLASFRNLLDSAEGDMQAGRLDQGFRKAWSVIEWNAQGIGRHDMLASSVAAASAVEAIRLLQRLAAQSLDEPQRVRWRHRVLAQFAAGGDSKLLALDLLRGEVSEHVWRADHGRLPKGASMADWNAQIVGYASLFEALDSAESLERACLDTLGAGAFCALVVRLERKQLALRDDISLLAELLAPRRKPPLGTRLAP